MDVMNSDFRFDATKLSALADRLRVEYSQGDPYPHIVIDDFLPAALLDKVVAEFPPAEQALWERRSTKNSLKLSCNILQELGLSTQLVLEQLNSRPMLRFLERLTGVEHLIPDALFEGGGLHQILPGGFLKIHADFNIHPEWNLDRRLNVLLFLNKDWSDAYGGEFELWDAKMAGCKKTVLPLFNRLVIFSTTDTAYHGHPHPLRCPEGMTRKSIAAYYYTNGRPKNEVAPFHSTIYRRRSIREWSLARIQQLLASFMQAVAPAPRRGEA